MTRKELYDVIKDSEGNDLVDYIKKKTGLHYTNVKTAELEMLYLEWYNDHTVDKFNEQHYNGLLEIVKNINEEIARLMNIRDELTREAKEFSHYVGLDLPF